MPTHPNAQKIIQSPYGVPLIGSRNVPIIGTRNVPTQPPPRPTPVFDPATVTPPPESWRPGFDPATVTPPPESWRPIRRPGNPGPIPTLQRPQPDRSTLPLPGPITNAPGQFNARPDVFGRTFQSAPTHTASPRSRQYRTAWERYLRTRGVR